MQDIRDFTDNIGGKNNEKSMDDNPTFEKEERAPPPQLRRNY